MVHRPRKRAKNANVQMKIETQRAHFALIARLEKFLHIFFYQQPRARDFRLWALRGIAFILPCRARQRA